MPKDANGNYTLPSPANPVVSGTTIDADNWCNPTMADIANVLTDCLSRTGKGGMINVLKLIDGTAANPALTFNDDDDTGLYRVADGEIGVSANGALSAVFAEALTVLFGDLLSKNGFGHLFENGAGSISDNGAFRLINEGNSFKLQRRNNAGDAWVDSVALDPQDGGDLNISNIIANAYDTGLYLANSAGEADGTNAFRIRTGLGDAFYIEVNTGTSGAPAWAEIIKLTDTVTEIANLVFTNLNVTSLIATSIECPNARINNVFHYRGGGTFWLGNTAYPGPGNVGDIGAFVLDTPNSVGASPLRMRVGLGGSVSDPVFTINPAEIWLRFPEAIGGITSLPTAPDSGERAVTKFYVDSSGFTLGNANGAFRYTGDPREGFAMATEMYATSPATTDPGTGNVVVNLPLTLDFVVDHVDVIPLIADLSATPIIMSIVDGSLTTSSFEVSARQYSGGFFGSFDPVSVDFLWRAVGRYST